MKSYDATPETFHNSIDSNFKPMSQIDHKKQLEAVLNSVIDAIITIDTRGTVLSFNTAAEKIFGYPAIEVMGKNVKLLMPEPYFSNHDSYLANYLRTGHKKVLGIGREAIGKRRDGSTFPIDLAVTEVVQADNRYFVGVVKDITEKRQAQETLLTNLETINKSREEFLDVLNQLRQGIVMFDLKGQITFLNTAAQKIFNRKIKDCLGLYWADILPYGRSSIDRLHQLLVSDNDGEKVKTTNRAPDGTVTCHEFEVLNASSDLSRRFFLISDLSDIYTLRQRLDERYAFQQLIGKSPSILKLFDKIKELSKVKITVLIEGETGTGKELVARALHNLSDRNDKPFIAVNCAGLTDTLIASQLFGHRKGAFTGATHDQKGLFEAANNGTIFLDEIGDISLELQKSLLRVLQEREYTRIGETMPRNIDVRVIAASHRNLEQEVRKGTFRQDLLYRIRIATLTIPPLRQRQEDIPLLANYFLKNCSIATGKQVHEISGDAMRLLLTHNWPGNVREFENAIEAAVVSCQGSVLEQADFPEFLFTSHAPGTVENFSNDEKTALITAMAECRGKKAAAAKRLGISRSTLYRRLSLYGLE